MKERKFANPYLAGIGLGLVLLASFLVAGRGLGASGAAYRAGVKVVHSIAPEHVAEQAYMGRTVEGGADPLHNYYVLLVIGVVLGGMVSSYAAGRMGRRIIRGPRIGPMPRLLLAVAGGAIMGFAARLTLGCTSGQALSGGALMSAGSWIFMFAVFGGGYAAATLVRRQWT